jgi:hypothetical protein
LYHNKKYFLSIIFLTFLNINPYKTEVFMRVQARLDRMCAPEVQDRSLSLVHLLLAATWIGGICLIGQRPLAGRLMLGVALPLQVALGCWGSYCKPARAAVGDEPDIEEEKRQFLTGIAGALQQLQAEVVMAPLAGVLDAEIAKRKQEVTERYVGTLELLNSATGRGDADAVTLQGSAVKTIEQMLTTQKAEVNRLIELAALDADIAGARRSVDPLREAIAQIRGVEKNDPNAAELCQKIVPQMELVVSLTDRYVAQLEKAKADLTNGGDATAAMIAAKVLLGQLDVELANLKQMRPAPKPEGQ